MYVFTTATTLVQDSRRETLTFELSRTFNNRGNEVEKISLRDPQLSDQAFICLRVLISFRFGLQLLKLIEARTSPSPCWWTSHLRNAPAASISCMVRASARATEAADGWCTGIPVMTLKANEMALGKMSAGLTRTVFCHPATRKRGHTHHGGRWLTGSPYVSSKNRSDWPEEILSRE